MELIKRFMVEEEGANATEYALVIGLIALAIVAAVTGVGTALSTAFTNIGTSVTNHVTAK
ncbi:MAG TPA: Flp family type IVb pilin [Chloroflexota bacterium]|jgi:pilus assembly protein Flp/PilA|nr:Flp family type IVb pilin [Chloroflexota bacterium]